MTSKRLYKYLYMLAAVVLISSCWSETDPQELPIKHDTTTTALELEKETEEYVDARRDNVQAQINEVIEDTRRFVDRLDLWRQNQNIPAEARLRSKRLRDTLLELQRSLENSLDSVTRASEQHYEQIDPKIRAHIKRAEQDLEQINEEMKAWKDENIKKSQ